MRLLDGQAAPVTGASGGIGRGIALRFADEGAAVVLQCRTAVAAAREVASRIKDWGARAVVLAADPRDEDECRRLVREAAAWGGGLAALVNNAGVRPALPRTTAADRIHRGASPRARARPLLRLQGGGRRHWSTDR
jgi:NAD(P)-dependent dehydrogenase (short-subunit alcohol dehydrogenase family)